MKTTRNKPVTPQQIKAIHASCKAMDEDMRRDLIQQFSNGRTRSSKELTFDEARALLEKLNEGSDRVKAMLEKDRLVLMRNIYHLSMKIEFLNKGFTSDTYEDHEMNKAKINRFTLSKGVIKKKVGLMSIEELRETKKQFEAILRKQNNDK